MSVTVTLGRQGRLVIPAGVRRDLGLREGDTLQMTTTPDGIVLSRERTRGEAVDAARGALSHLAPGRSLVDELIAERRAEAARDGEQA